MTQFKNSREPVLKSEGTFFERKGYYLQWRLDKYVDNGKLTDNEAEEMHDRWVNMFESEDHEIRNLAQIIVDAKLKELRAS